MTDQLKTIFKRAVKQAVIALSVSGAALWHDSTRFNFHSWDGVKGCIELWATAVLVSEFYFFWPKIVAWANTADN